MKNIYILKICSINGAKVTENKTYAFEKEEQMNAVAEALSNDPNSNVGKNPGTLIFRETVSYFEETDHPLVNIPVKQKNDAFNRLSKGISLPWKYKRPFR